MTTSIVCELRKLTGNAVTWVLLALVAAAFVAVPAVIAGLDGSVTTAEIGGGLALLVPVVLMAVASLVVTEEYRSQTVWQSFVAVPRRWRFLAGKAVLVAPVAAVGVAVASVAAVGAAVGVAGILVGAPPGAGLTVGAIGELALRCAALGGVCAVLGLVVGALTRHAATAVALLLVWGAALERIVGSFPEIGPLAAPVLPLNNLRYFVTGDTGGIAFAWGPGGGLGYVLIICAVLYAAGQRVTERVEP